MTFLNDIKKYWDDRRRANLIKKVWEKAKKAKGRDPDFVRIARYSQDIHFRSYGDDSQFGWYICRDTHDGGDGIENLIPLHHSHSRQRKVDV